MFVAFKGKLITSDLRMVNIIKSSIASLWLAYCRLTLNDQLLKATTL